MSRKLKQLKDTHSLTMLAEATRLSYRHTDNEFLIHNDVLIFETNAFSPYYYGQFSVLHMVRFLEYFCKMYITEKCIRTFKIEAISNDGKSAPLKFNINTDFTDSIWSRKSALIEALKHLRQFVLVLDSTKSDLADAVMVTVVSGGFTRKNISVRQFARMLYHIMHTTIKTGKCEPINISVCSSDADMSVIKKGYSVRYETGRDLPEIPLMTYSMFGKEYKKTAGLVPVIPRYAANYTDILNNELGTSDSFCGVTELSGLLGLEPTTIRGKFHKKNGSVQFSNQWRKRNSKRSYLYDSKAINLYCKALNYGKYKKAKGVVWVSEADLVRVIKLAIGTVRVYFRDPRAREYRSFKFNSSWKRRKKNSHKIEYDLKNIITCCIEHSLGAFNERDKKN